MVMYIVYCGERFVGKYIAKNSEEAIRQATANQTGNANHLYRAEVINDSN